MDLIIREMKQADAPGWDKYVAAHPEGTFCHRAGWARAVQNGAGQRCCCLLAEKGGEIVGVLPLSFRNSSLFGKALISTMFAVYGGPLADDTNIYAALDDAGWKLATDMGAEILEYRSIKARHNNQSGTGPQQGATWAVTEGHAATFRKPLKSTEEEVLLDIPRKQRAVVRKSLKTGLRCAWDKDIDTFYKLYAESVRNLGTPVFPKKIFSEFVDQFGDDVEIQVIYAPDGKAVASLMSFYDETSVLPYYAGGSIDARRYGAHDFMYYHLMLRAASLGKTVFDFGRSKVGTGAYKFKKNWGFEATPLNYEYRLLAGAPIPDLNPTSAKYNFMVKMWKKLPLPVANFVGPYIARHLG